jgi:hypothetical protein
VPASALAVDDYYDPTAAPDKTYARRGGVPRRVEFDPLESAIPPNVSGDRHLAAAGADRRAAVLDDASRASSRQLDRERTSVILGVTSAQELLVDDGPRLQRPVWVKALREHGPARGEVQRCATASRHYVPWQESTLPRPARQRRRGPHREPLNLGGTNCVTDAACAELARRCDGRIRAVPRRQRPGDRGGVETLNDIFMFMCFSKTPALSPSGDCRPFATSADGTMLGEGLAMLALRGSRTPSATATDLRGDPRHRLVVRRPPRASTRRCRRPGQGAAPRLRGRRLRPRDGRADGGHGTGTKAGDVGRVRGPAQVFDGTGRATAVVRARLGEVPDRPHQGRRGAAGLFKVVMALHHKVLPPTIKVDEPNPRSSIERRPFYLNTEARPWIRGRAPAARVGQLVRLRRQQLPRHGRGITRAGPAPARVAAWPASCCCLRRGSRACSRRCEASSSRHARTARSRRSPASSWKRFDASLPARLALIASDASELAQKGAARLGRAARPAGAAVARSERRSLRARRRPGKLAFVFPGQGSQYLEMGADLARSFDASRSVWDGGRGGFLGAAAARRGLPAARVLGPRGAKRRSDGSRRRRGPSRASA